MTGYAVIDFETTGLAPELNDRVLEVGVVLVDARGNRESSWTTLVNPERDVGASHIHGITAGELLDAPNFKQVSNHLLGIISGRTLVAHNASFDMRFLHCELERAGLGVPERPVALCSMKWSGRLLGSAKLAHCCEALGIELTEAHTALGDAEATAQLLTFLMQRGSSLAEWHEDAAQSAAFPWPRTTQQAPPSQALRHRLDELRPSSWMEDVLANTWIPGAMHDEATYLVALDRALLDSNISRTEGRELIGIAADAGISADRMIEIHREYLESLAAEAWSDGELTDAELADLTSATASMGLTLEDLTSALHSAKTSHTQPRESLLQLGDRVVFTGTLNKPRDEWISEIVAKGLASGGISKSTKVVVAADPDSLSGKAAKARYYGIPVVSEAAFERHLAGYSATHSARLL